MTEKIYETSGLHENDSIDIDNLKNALDVITYKLRQTYVQRRRNLLNPDPIEELTNAIEELNSWEHEWKAAAGIANILIEQNKSLRLRVRQAVEGEESARASVTDLEAKLKLVQYECLQSEQRANKLEQQNHEWVEREAKLREEHLFAVALLKKRTDP